MKFETTKPDEIEARSMEIIMEELGDRTLPEPNFSILKRCIHTSADFDYFENLAFSDGAAEKGIAALRNGASIVTDTKMAAAGINKIKLKALGGDVHCYISDDDVVQDAKTEGCTRAVMSMRKAARMDGRVIFAIGNAPTALMELDRLIRKESIRPAMIIGVPVGFVNVVESKELIMATCEEFGIPFIVARGRKGGSNIAATICNAMIYYR